MRYNKITNNPKEREFCSYPYVYMDSIFSREEFAALISYCDTLKTEKGRVGQENVVGSLNIEIRNSNICLFGKDNDNQWIFDRLNTIIEILNDQFYGFELQGYEQIQYGIYDSSEQQHYNWHMDSHIGSIDINQETRKFSLSFLLSEPGVDFEGGEFEINQGEQENPIVAETKKNRIIGFPSWTIHRVKPVTKGIRKSLVIWVIGPKFR